MNSVILLVDDNAVQATTRKAILERSGYHVAIASNAKTALEILFSGETPHGVDLLITDHLMPGMNGPELISEVRRRGFALPVIVLSGLPDAESAYAGLNVAFRMKPLPPESLIAVTRELLCRRMPRTA